MADLFLSDHAETVSLPEIPFPPWRAPISRWAPGGRKHPPRNARAKPS